MSAKLVCTACYIYWLFTLSVIYAHCVSKENVFVLRSLQNDWNYFWNKYCNLPFLAICRSLLPLLIFLASSWYQKAKIGLRMSLQNKKMINYHIKNFIKQPVIKQGPTFLSLSFLIDCCESVFSLPLSKRLLILKNWQDFTSKLSLKILIKIFS